MTSQRDVTNAASTHYMLPRSTGSATTPSPSTATNTSSTGFRLPVARNHALRASEITARSIASRLVEFCHLHGDVITNLRLQKLLYYAQAWHLAIKNRKLFSEPFEAWPNGPVQPEVFSYYQRFGTGPIAYEPSGIVLPDATEEHIKDVMQIYGRYSPFELELLTCQEFPWIEARAGLAPDAPSSAEIRTATMKSYYRQQLDGERKEQGT